LHDVLERSRGWLVFPVGVSAVLALALAQLFLKRIAAYGVCSSLAAWIVGI